MEAGTMEFGSVLKALRLRAGLSLEAVARRVGGTHSLYIEQLETGQVKTQAWDFIARLAGIFSVDVDAFRALAYASRAPAEVKKTLLHAVWVQHAKGNWR